MKSIQSASFLRRVLMVDAVCSGAMGAAMIALAAVLGDVLQLPADLLREAGIVLIPFVAFVGFLATRAQPARFAVWAVIALNLVWVADSILLLLTGDAAAPVGASDAAAPVGASAASEPPTGGWVAPNALGYAFVIGQALVVAVFAGLEYVGLRRTPATAA